MHDVECALRCMHARTASEADAWMGGWMVGGALSERASEQASV